MKELERPKEESYHASEMYLWKDAINEYCEQIEKERDGLLTNNIDRMNDSFRAYVKRLEKGVKELTEDNVKSNQELQALKDKIKKLEYMIENGLGEKDMENDITYPNEK